MPTVQISHRVLFSVVMDLSSSILFMYSMEFAKGVIDWLLMGLPQLLHVLVMLFCFIISSIIICLGGI